jgi:uncharacterized membrane protein YjfL (UPF0719 family)
MHVAFGGAIGGALTLPIQTLSSPAAMVRLSLRGVLFWGVSFLVFQVLAFYSGYFLMLMTAESLASWFGCDWATIPGWALSAGVCGFLAARIASISLSFTKRTVD